MDSAAVSVEYKIKVYTGHLPYAGTDAGVYVTLIGSLGETPEVHLSTAIGKTKSSFERGQCDTFEFSQCDVGEPKRIVLRQDGKGIAAWWFVSHLEVFKRAPGDNFRLYVFPAYEWLSRQKGLQRDLLCAPLLDRCPRVVKGHFGARPTAKYTVVAFNEGQQTTTSDVFVSVYGCYGAVERKKVRLGRQRCREDSFEGPDIGLLTKVIIEITPKGSQQDWHLSHLWLLKQPVQGGLQRSNSFVSSILTRVMAKPATTAMHRWLLCVHEQLSFARGTGKSMLVPCAAPPQESPSLPLAVQSNHSILQQPLESMSGAWSMPQTQQTLTGPAWQGGVQPSMRMTQEQAHDLALPPPAGWGTHSGPLPHADDAQQGYPGPAWALPHNDEVDQVISMYPPVGGMQGLSTPSHNAEHYPSTSAPQRLDSHPVAQGPNGYHLPTQSPAYDSYPQPNYDSNPMAPRPAPMPGQPGPEELLRSWLRAQPDQLSTGPQAAAAGQPNYLGTIDTPEPALTHEEYPPPWYSIPKPRETTAEHGTYPSPIYRLPEDHPWVAPAPSQQQAVPAGAWQSSSAAEPNNQSWERLGSGVSTNGPGPATNSMAAHYPTIALSPHNSHLSPSPGTVAENHAYPDPVFSPPLPQSTGYSHANMWGGQPAGPPVGEATSQQQQQEGAEGMATSQALQWAGQQEAGPQLYPPPWYSNRSQVRELNTCTEQQPPPADHFQDGSHGHGDSSALQRHSSSVVKAVSC